MKRQFRNMMLAGAATLLIPAPASWAQEPDPLEQEARSARQNLRKLRQFEADLRQAEAARLRGDCDRVRRLADAMRDFRGLPPDYPSEFERRMREIAAQDCPPGSGTPSVAPRVAQPSPGPAPVTPAPLTIELPPLPENAGIDDCPDASPLDAMSPVCPDAAQPPSTGSTTTSTPPPAAAEEPGSILDEAADDIGSTAPSRTPAPAPGTPPPTGAPEGRVPRVVPAPVGATTQPAPPPRTFYEPSNPTPTPPGSVSLPSAATTVSRQEREDDEQRALTALEAIRLRGDCDSYRAERERLRPLLDVLSLPPELPCPPSGTQVSTTGVSQGTIVDTDEISLIISGALDFGEVDIPAAGIGVSRAGPAGQAPEETAGETADTVRTIGFGLEGMFYIPGSDTLLQISGRYLAGDADRTFAAGGGTIDAGIVYGDLSPGGSSGIIGRTELTGDANVDVEEIRLRTELGLTAGGVYASRWYEDPDAGPPSSTSAKAAPGYSLGLYGEYIHSDRDYALSLSGFSTANPALQFSQERIQSISENYFGLGISGELRVPLGGALIARAGASGGGYYLTSSLSSFERNTNNFSAAVDRDFTIEIEDDDNGFGVMGEANAGLELMLAPSASVFVEGRVGYRSRVGAIFNPNSGDQVFVDGLTTELTTDNSWSYGAIIGLNFRL